MVVILMPRSNGYVTVDIPNFTVVAVVCIFADEVSIAKYFPK